MEETIWQRFDKVISHLVREGQINLAVDAGRARDEALQLMEENPKTSLNEKSTVPLEATPKVCHVCKRKTAVPITFYKCLEDDCRWKGKPS